MDLGPNAVFIWASYGVTALVLLGLSGWLIAYGARLRRRLETLEYRGHRRHHHTPPPDMTETPS